MPLTHDPVNPATPSAAAGARLLTLLREMSLAVAEAESAETALSAVLAQICRFMGWPFGHAYVKADSGDRLVSSRVWYLDDPDALPAFRALSEATTFQRDEGTIGRVWVTGRPIAILDVRATPAFVRRLPVSDSGIRAYFAFPVVDKSGVSAVLEFFSLQAAAPDPAVSDLILHTSAVLGLALQRQRMLSQLQRSQAQLAEAQHTARLGSWEWDVQRNELTWSPELFRVYGLAPDDFSATYEAFLARVHPDDRQFVQDVVREAYEQKRPFDYYHRIIRPDGSERTLHGRGRPIFDADGNITKLHGTGQDVTEQKEAEKRLEQTVRKLSALMEIAQAVAATLDLPVVYERVLTLVRPLIGAEALILFLHQDDMLEIVAVEPAGFADLRALRMPLHAGIAGDVWQHAHSLLLRGDECVRRLAPQLLQRSGYRPNAMLAVPVRWQSRAVGVLEATHRDPDTFDEADLRLLETAAAWTAIAIGNARQYDQLQRRLSESDTIAAISTALTETLDVDELLQLIVNHVQTTVPNAEQTAIHLLQPRTNQLERVAGAGLPDAAAGNAAAGSAFAERIDSGDGIAGRVMAQGGVINIADAQADGATPVDRAAGARSLLVAPVESRQGRIGTITLQCAAAGAFSAEDERLVRILGVQAGMALENARLYDAQRRARLRAEKQRERMRQMAQRIVQAQEDERSRIARELHDESGQALTSLKISLELLRAMLPDDQAAVRDGMADVLALADRTMSRLRLLSHNLRPPGLDSYGLDAALAGLCQDFAAHTQLTVTYDGVELTDLAPLAELSLYRFAQEALTNVVKHADATAVHVTLTQTPGAVRLTVADNGRGFAPPNLDRALPAHGAGLVGMIERLEMVEGHLEVDAEPGQGARLTAVLPLHDDEAA